MDKQVSCISTKVIIDYIQKHSPGDLEMLLEDLDPEIDDSEDPFVFLTDVNNWTSSTVWRKMMERARGIMRDDDIAFKIGFDSTKMTRLGHMQKILVRTFGSPKEALRRVQAINEKFSKTKAVELFHIEAAQAILRLHWFAGMDCIKDGCRFNQGIYTAMPTVWRLPPAQLVETKCFFNGDPYCEYHLKWSRFFRSRHVRDPLFARRLILEDMLEELEKDRALLQKKAVKADHLNGQYAEWMEEINRSERELKELSARLLSIQEEERRRISRDLHDSVGQALSAIKLDLELLRDRTSGKADDLKAGLEENIGSLAMAIRELRSISADLRPPLLDDLGLIPTLRWYTGMYTLPYVDVAFSSDLSDQLNLAKETEIAVFRIVQEALSNAVRHARAEHITVQVKEAHDAIHIVVQDDGMGFEVNRTLDSLWQGEGMGLVNMRERARLLNAELRVESRLGQGTRVWLSVPVR